MTIPAHRTFVYFAKGGKSGLIKIGYSADPDKRCLNFSDRKQQGEAGKVLFAVPGGRAEEANFHDQFDEYRIRGEWFVCKGQLAAFIKEGRKIHKKWRTQVEHVPPKRFGQPAIEVKFSFAGPAPVPEGARAMRVAPEIGRRLCASRLTWKEKAEILDMPISTVQRHYGVHKS